MSSPAKGGRPPKMVIIGAGLTGLLAAQGLKKVHN
jgi:monoamine oxidase